jgi:hypothetical protein
MARTRRTDQQSLDQRPFITPEAEENYCVSLAYSLVERRLKEGTASSQETTHFLKIGSVKERKELEKLEEENKLLRAKTEALQSQKQSEELYANAIAAFRKYSGQGDENEDY